MKLIKGVNGPNICRSILDLIYQKEISFDKLGFKQDEDFKIFHKTLLSVSINKNELEMVVKIFEGLYPCLNFINENIDLILTMDSKCFPINLDPPREKDDINEILRLINEITNKNTKKKFKVINIEDIFDNLLNYAYYKDIKELYKLSKFIPLLSKDKKGQNLINNFYKKIHQKGMSLITNKKMTTEEIFDFIMTHDIYYCKQIHAKSEFRDPEIFKYIPITKTKKDDIEYLKNISIIKNNRLFDLFSAHNYEVKKKI
jgi:hypothetical protein